MKDSGQYRGPWVIWRRVGDTENSEQYGGEWVIQRTAGSTEESV